MELIGKGRQAEVFAVNSEECVKLFYEDCPRSVIEGEAKIMQYISSLPIPSPKFLGLMQKKNRYGIRMERLHGHSMMKEMMSNPEKLIADAEELGRIQRNFHQIKAEGCTMFTDSMAQAIKTTTLLDENEKELLLKRLSELPMGDRLLHTDYHVDNLIVTSEKIYVIDWSGVACGNALADVARTILTCNIGTYPIDATRELCDLLDQFRNVTKEAYLRGYGIQEEELADWIPLVAAWRLKSAPEEERVVNLSIIREYLKLFKE